MHSHYNTNPQGWLPLGCPFGQWWQGQLYMATPSYRRKNRKAPAIPLTTRPGGVRSRRAPGQSESERGGSRTEEKMELHPLNIIRYIF